METKAKKQKVEFIAVAQFGWKHASSPAMAIQKVRDFTFMQDRPEREDLTSGSKPKNPSSYGW